MARGFGGFQVSVVWGGAGGGGLLVGVVETAFCFCCRGFVYVIF